MLNNSSHWNFCSRCVRTRQEIEEFLVKCPGFSPTKHTFGKDFLSFSKNGLYLTQKSEFSCKVGQKIEKMGTVGSQELCKLAFYPKKPLKSEK